MNRKEIKAKAAALQELERLENLSTHPYLRQTLMGVFPTHIDIVGPFGLIDSYYPSVEGWKAIITDIEIAIENQAKKV